MTVDTPRLTKLITAASPATKDHLVRILERDASDRAWAAQIGPALTQADVARLLGVSVQAVSKNRSLLRISNRDGRVVYPVVQFDGRSPLKGVAEVLAVLDGPLLPLTVASWLTSSKTDLGGRTAIEALHDGDREQVLLLARQSADSAA